MGDLLGSINIIEVILEGLGKLSYVFDVLFILFLLPRFIGSFKRSIFKTLFRIVFYAAAFTTALLMIDQITNYVGESLLSQVGLKLSLTYNEVTTDFTNLFDYFKHIFAYDSTVSPEYIEALSFIVVKNITWMMLYPLLLISCYIVSQVLWFIITIFFPKPLRKKIKQTKLRLLNVPLQLVFSLVLALFMIAPYVNLSSALKEVVIDPDSPIAFLSPSYGGILSWFTPEKSFILNFLDVIKIPQLFVYFDTFSVNQGGTITDFKFAEELHAIINRIGEIVPTP